MKPSELKAARAYLGMTQAEMAKWLGYANREAVLRWERGKTPIPGPVALLLGWLVWDKHPLKGTGLIKQEREFVAVKVRSMPWQTPSQGYSNTIASGRAAIDAADEDA